MNSFHNVKHPSYIQSVYHSLSSQRQPEKRHQSPNINNIIHNNSIQNNFKFNLNFNFQDKCNNKVNTTCPNSYRKLDQTSYINSNNQNNHKNHKNYNSSFQNSNQNKKNQTFTINNNNLFSNQVNSARCHYQKNNFTHYPIKKQLNSYRKNQNKVSLKNYQPSLNNEQNQSKYIKIQDSSLNKSVSPPQKILNNCYQNNINQSLFNKNYQITSSKNRQRQRKKIPSFLANHQHQTQKMLENNNKNLKSNYQPNINNFQKNQSIQKLVLDRNSQEKIKNQTKQISNKINIKNFQNNLLPIRPILKKDHNLKYYGIKYSNQNIFQNFNENCQIRPSITQNSTTANMNSERASTIQRFSEQRRQSIQHSNNCSSLNKRQPIQANCNARSISPASHNVFERQLRQFNCQKIYSHRHQASHHPFDNYLSPKIHGQGKFFHRNLSPQMQSRQVIYKNHRTNNNMQPFSNFNHSLVNISQDIKRPIFQHKKFQQDSFKMFFVWDFKKIKQIGKGKFGVVNLVKHKETGFICAMKIINKKIAKQESVQHQISKQIKINYQLSKQNQNNFEATKNSRHFISLYGFFEDYEHFYILMQYATYGTLFDLIKQKTKMEEGQVSPLIKGLCEGIKYMHSFNCIHRDLKPQNIMLQFDVPKICDFGWATKLKQQDNFVTTSLAGTPLYYSPEMVKQQSYGKQIDMWALGVLTYECLQGRIPFRIYTEADLKQIVQKQIQFPQFLDFSQSAKDFIKKALNKNCKQRLTQENALAHSFLSKRYQPWACYNSNSKLMGADNYDYDIYRFMKSRF